MIEGFRPSALTIDADGVLHRGAQLLPGAVDLLEQLDACKIPWKIVTNNSRQTRQAAAAVYRRLGLPVGDDNVRTAADALAAYIVAQSPDNQHPVVFSLGAPEL